MTLPSSGQITLNEMHVEVGGSTGTESALNDSDIRGLIGKSSGAQMSFNEWYGATSYVAPTLYSSGANYGSRSNTTSYSYGANIGSAPSGSNRRLVVVAAGNRGGYGSGTITVGGTSTTLLWYGKSAGGADSPNAFLAWCEKSSGSSATIALSCSWGTGAGMTTWAITGVPLPYKQGHDTYSNSSGATVGPSGRTAYSWFFAVRMTRTKGTSSWGGGMTESYDYSVYGSDYFNSAYGQRGTGTGTFSGSSGNYSATIVAAFNGA